jgi:hypothetical protein
MAEIPGATLVEVKSVGTVLERWALSHLRFFKKGRPVKILSHGRHFVNSTVDAEGFRGALEAEQLTGPLKAELEASGSGTEVLRSNQKSWKSKRADGIRIIRDISPWYSKIRSSREEKRDEEHFESWSSRWSVVASDIFRQAAWTHLCPGA